MKKLFKKIKKRKINYDELKGNVKDSFEAIIQKMLISDPDDRPTINKVLEVKFLVNLYSSFYFKCLILNYYFRNRFSRNT